MVVCAAEVVGVTTAAGVTALARAKVVGVRQRDRDREPPRKWQLGWAQRGVVVGMWVDGVGVASGRKASDDCGGQRQCRAGTDVRADRCEQRLWQG